MELAKSSLYEITPDNGRCLAQCLYNFFQIGVYIYIYKVIQENQVGLKLNGTRQFLAYANDVNPLGHDIGTIKKNQETLIVDSKDVCLGINVEKTKYMRVCNHQNAGQSRDKK
jgi:hypothetical protein